VSSCLARGHQRTCFWLGLWRLLVQSGNQLELTGTGVTEWWPPVSCVTMDTLLPSPHVWCIVLTPSLPSYVPAVLREAIPLGRATGEITRRWPRRSRSTRTRCAPCTSLDVLWCQRLWTELDSHETSYTQTNRCPALSDSSIEHETPLVYWILHFQNAFRPGFQTWILNCRPV
jgi:hypothetical protein